jgi:L-fuconolactonase
MSVGTVIDSHQHFWDPETAEYPWMVDAYAPLHRRYGPEDLEPHLRSVGVDCTIVVQARHHLDETRRLLQIADTTSWVAGVVGWVDLTAADVADTLDTLRSAPGGRRLVGIRHLAHDEPNPEWLLRPDVLRGLQKVADAGLTYDLLVRSRELPAARTVAQRLPQLRLVLDHVAKPPIASGEVEPWGSLLRQLQTLENVACKVSGLVTEARWRQWKSAELQPYLETAVETFGPERLMFGSDWPVCLLSADYSEVFEFTVSILTSLIGDDLEGVLGGCASRVYRPESIT